MPTLSLLFVLNKNSFPFETLYVWKFFPTRTQIVLTSLPSPGPLSWITLTICCPLAAQSRKVPLAWSFPLTSHAWSAGAPTVSGQAVFCVLERPLWCHVEETGGTHEVSPHHHSNQYPKTYLFTLDGPGGVSGEVPQHVLVLI